VYVCAGPTTTLSAVKCRSRERLVLRRHRVWRTLYWLNVRRNGCRISLKGSDGLTCGEVRERLSTRDSDITRLLDRLELLGFVARRRERPDRRVVRTQITEQGTGVLDAVDKLVGELQVRHLGHLGPKKLSVQRAAEVGGDHWAHRMKVAKTDTEVSDECFRE
jgi:DNA-binding MarR family transcriptional regulator